MRIFLSYASEDLAIAQSIAHSLASYKYKVFFDKSELPAGESYDNRIQSAIASSWYFIFLVSKHSLQQGRYTMTELGMAREKWPHSGGRILPVILDPDITPDSTEIPAYLRSVTMLSPSGNVPAEVANAIHILSAKTRKLRRLFIFSASLIALSAIYLTIYTRPPELEFHILPATELDTRVADNIFIFRYKLKNNGSELTRIKNVEIQSNPIGHLSVYTSDYVNGRSIGSANLLPAESDDFWYWAQLEPGSPDNLSYKVCVNTLDGEKHCSPYVPWEVEDEDQNN